MKVEYILNKESFTYTLKQGKDIFFGLVLPNKRGDFLEIGIDKNFSKYNGFNVYNEKTNEIFKFLDEIVLTGVKTEKVIFDGISFKRIFSNKFISYDEKIDNNGFNKCYDTFYVGPSGGFVYEISGYEGEISFDLNIKKQFDFTKWGKIYEIFFEKDILIAHFKKINSENCEYEGFFGVKVLNVNLDIVKKWIEKEYDYSKFRGSNSNDFVFRLFKTKIIDFKRFICGTGFSKKDVLTQIDLLEKHHLELKRFDMQSFTDLSNLDEFEKPLQYDLSVAYRISKPAILNFLNRDFDIKKHSFSYAGFGWFSKNWARDELISLRALINLGEFLIVKDILLSYLSRISEDGLILRIDEKGSFKSCDTLFWLTKRFIDFIFLLDSLGKLNDYFSEEEMKYFYHKLKFSFKKISSNFWDFENELLKVNFGDSWMDTINVQYPLDMQVLYLNFISDLSILSKLLNKTEDSLKFLNLEQGLKEKIRITYFRNNNLYDEPFNDKISSNIFLAYYIYPDLFLKKDWEIIFDNAIKNIESTWGGFSSLSIKDSRFQPNYLGESNLSYHKGDCWFWINNISAISMFDLNEKKYRSKINKILLTSTKDILKMGDLGYSSELSSFSTQKAQGNLAQLWSSATFIEMVDKIFSKKF